MTAKRVFQIVVVASVVLLAVGVGPRFTETARALPPAQEAGPEGATIPYSGRLTDDGGQPVADGAYDFAFALYDAPEGGTLLWSETQTGVEVQGGAFTAALGSVSTLPAAAEGRGLWLEVGVRGPEEAEFTLLNPRQALSAAASVGPASPSAGPACAHDHLGENWVGAYSLGLRVESTSTQGGGILGVGTFFGVEGSSNWIGVLGDSIDGTGVLGNSTNWIGVQGGSGNGIGVRGGSSNGTAVFGYSEHAIGVAGVGATYGVSGTATSGAGVYGSSTDGVGVRGLSDNRTGVFGGSSNEEGVRGDSGFGVGVYGKSYYDIGVAGVGATVGVSGTVTTASGTGVYGSSANWIGVKGESTNGTGVYGDGDNGAGVFGDSDNGTGVSGHSDNWTGVYGGSTGGIGVWGYSGLGTGVAGVGATYGVSGTATSGVGVYGGSTSGRGVYGNSTSDVGVYGQSASNTGVAGKSTSGVGVWGESSGSRGVYGKSTSDVGVYGESASNTGVAGKSTNGVGVWGESISGIGVYGFSGNNTGVFVVSFIADPIIAQGGNPPHNVFRVDHTGRGYFNGGHQDGGADVAEFIQASDSVEPGDVVEIDPDHPGQFRLATTANTTAVAGVISTNPGESLGAIDPAGAENSGPQLAVAGRVPVKVSAENGAIHPGDLLVASSTPGHAMRAPGEPAPGTVIGKALGDLDSGTGVIEMLVMLR